MSSNEDLTIKSAIDGYKKKKFSCEEITKYYLDNIIKKKKIKLFYYRNS